MRNFVLVKQQVLVYKICFNNLVSVINFIYFSCSRTSGGRRWVFIISHRLKAIKLLISFKIDLVSLKYLILLRAPPKIPFRNRTIPLCYIFWSVLSSNTHWLNTPEACILIFQRGIMLFWLILFTFEITKFTSCFFL